jgi:hypothetical protein
MRIKLKILQQGFGLEGDIYVRKQFPLERRNRHYPDLKPPKHGGGRNINPRKRRLLLLDQMLGSTYHKAQGITLTDKHAAASNAEKVSDVFWR